MNAKVQIAAATLLHPAEAAELLRCSERHIHRLIERGRIPARKESRRVLIERVALERYLATLPVKGAA